MHSAYLPIPSGARVGITCKQSVIIGVGLNRINTHEHGSGRGGLSEEGQRKSEPCWNPVISCKWQDPFIRVFKSSAAVTGRRRRRRRSDCSCFQNNYRASSRNANGTTRVCAHSDRRVYYEMFYLNLPEFFWSVSQSICFSCNSRGTGTFKVDQVQRSKCLNV